MEGDDGEDRDPAQSVDVGTIRTRSGRPGSAQRLVVDGDVIDVGGSRCPPYPDLRDVLQKCTNW
jgi:hypothetical protein